MPKIMLINHSWEKALAISLKLHRFVSFWEFEFVYTCYLNSLYFTYSYYLQIGVPVLVLSTKGDSPEKGYIRYVGETEFAQGTWVGVQLDNMKGRSWPILPHCIWYCIRLSHMYYNQEISHIICSLVVIQKLQAVYRVVSTLHSQAHYVLYNEVVKR